MEDRSNQVQSKPGIRSKACPTIALLTHSISDSYGSLQWAGVADATQNGNANLICLPGWAIQTTRGFDAQANILYEMVGPDTVDGLVISSGVLGDFIGRDGLEKFCERYRPLPMVSIAVELKNIPSILIDNRKAMSEMVAHLIETHGRTHFAFISGPSGNKEAIARYEGFNDALESHGLTADPRLVSPPTSWDDDPGMEATKFLLDERAAKPGTDFEVIVTGSDNLAYGVLKELTWRGIQVPKDVLLTGFDDKERSKFLTPPLTTVYQPIYEQAYRATEMLLAQVRGNAAEPGVIELPTKLVIRQSCGCLHPSVVHAEVGSASTTGTTSKMALKVKRDTILHDIIELTKNSSNNKIVPEVEQLLNAFYTELKEQPQGSFLLSLDEILSQLDVADSDVSVWQEILSLIRLHILPSLEPGEQRFHIEDIFHQARVMIGERTQRSQGYRRFEAEQQTKTLDGINQALVTTSDLDKLMEFLVKGLHQLKIPGCFVSLYENPALPTEWSRPILVYENSTGLAVVATRAERFQSRRFVPDNMLSSDRLKSLVVEPLYFEQNQLGLAAFEVGPRKGIIYETLRGQLSSALWGARLVGYLRSLYEAGADVMSLQEPDAILQKVADHACKSVGASSANIILVNRDGQPRRLATGGDQTRPVATSTLEGVAVTAREAMEKDKPILIPDATEKGQAASLGILQAGFGAGGCFPLRLRDNPIGVMWVFYEKPHHFPDAEVEALKLYVNQAAIAYDNVRRVKELEHLRQAAEKLASVAEVHDVLRQITESACDVLQADSVVIWSYDTSRRTFLPGETVGFGLRPRLLDKFKEDKPSPGGTAEIVMRHGYLAVEDVSDPQYKDIDPTARGLRGEIDARSFQGIALRAEGETGETLGILYVNYKQRRGFSEEEESTLRTFAYHAALTLKKARLLERVRRTIDTAQVVAEVSLQENLPGTLDAIARGTLDVFHCDAVTLYPYNSATQELGHPPTISGLKHPELVRRLNKVERDSIVYKILEREEPEIVEVIAESDDFKNRRFVKDEEIKSCVALPLKAAGQKVGVMFVNYRTEHHFTGEDIADIKLFAYQAAVAIRNAQLRDDATRKTGYLEALYEAGTAVTSTLSLDEILEQIVIQASQLTIKTGGKQAHFCYLALKEGDKLRFKTSYSPDLEAAPIEKAYIIDLESDQRIGIVGRAVKTGKSQLVSDVTQDPDYITDDQTTLSLLAVPILIGEEVVGVIDVEHSSNSAFDKDDQLALEALADQAAIAIQNARQYDELRRTKGQVGSRTALVWMGMASNAWRHTIDKHARTIIEQVDLLRRELVQALQPNSLFEADRRLAIIQKLARQIEEKPITPPLSSEEGVVSVSVDDLLQERTERLWESEPYKSVGLKLDLALNDALTVRASPEWLRRALDILINNAIDAMIDCSHQHLLIETRQKGNLFEILIRDHGKGISPEIHQHIFIDPIKKLKGAKGLGVGLLMAQVIIQTYDGEIGVESTGPEGTTMFVRLPLEI